MKFLFYVQLLGASTGFLLTGCASVSVKDEQAVNGEKTGQPVSKPPVIYVENFSTDGAEFNVDRTGPELTQFKSDTANELAVEMQKGFIKDIGPSTRFGLGLAIPRSGWMVRGQFTRVNQGSRAMRAIIGFGAGGTKMETMVKVFDLAQPGSGPFLTFETTGGSGAMPGGVTGLATGSILVAGAGLVGGSAKGISSDEKRTAKMIVARVSDYLFHRGWISADKHISPKTED